MLDQLGPAINGAHSLFVYGPPGNGKTVIAQAIRNILDGVIAIPRAIETDGQIIQVFDPVVHEPVAGAARPAEWTAARAPTSAGCTAGGRCSPSAAS